MGTNTMSLQYHGRLLQYHEPNQYHEPSIPRALRFALFERFSPYATWHVLNRVHTRLPLDIPAYALKHTLFIMDLVHAEFLSLLPSVHTVDTSYLAHQEHCHHLQQMGCLLRTTLSTILLTNIISHQIYIIYQVHQVKYYFIRWFAIKDNTCQQSHVFIFI